MRLIDADNLTALLAMTKAELIEQLRCAEHNQAVAEERLSQQAENVKDWAPVKHGRWKHNVDDCWLCSECGLYWHTLNGKSPEENYMNFCPVCGAKMDGGNDNG